jgi:SAM-dependent methyltransferase
MTDYDKTFSMRGSQYKYAVEKYPNVLHEEFSNAATMIYKTGAASVVNIPAACVPLASYLSSLEYTVFETNKSFADLTNTPWCSLDTIPILDDSIDCVISLASLHHASNKERCDFYNEVLRILRPNGNLIIGDVIKNSSQDKWLNEFVNKHNSAGHNGIFWSEKDMQLLVDSGFNSVEYCEISYFWNYDNVESMIDFSKNLFGLDKASNTQIYQGIVEYLFPIFTNGAIKIPWKLGYFICSKSMP